MYDFERSVCDAVKFRNKIGADMLGEILRNYVRRNDKNLDKLLKYASELRISNTMNQLLQVILWQIPENPFAHACSILLRKRECLFPVGDHPVHAWAAAISCFTLQGMPSIALTGWDSRGMWAKRGHDWVYNVYRGCERFRGWLQRGDRGWVAGWWE